MSHPILILIATLGFCGWCLFVDADEASAATNNFFLAACRIVARHIKLLLRFLLAVGITFVAIMALFDIGSLVSAKIATGGGGPQTERLARFMNEGTWPVQFMLDGFTTILGVFAALTLLFFEKFCQWYLAHARACNLALLAFYVIWLVWNVWNIVDEVCEHRGTAIVCTTLALGLWVGAEVAVVIHLWPALTEIHQVVVSYIYSSPYS